MNSPDSETIILICTTVTAAFAAVFGWVKWWYEIREKNKEKAEKEKEKAAKEKAEKELKEIKRRADAPYFSVSDTAFQRLFHQRLPNEVRYWDTSRENLLCYMRDEVSKQTPKDQPIILVSGQFRALRQATTLSITIRAKWTLDILCLAAKAVESRGGKETELFFSVTANAWNPKGKRLRGEMKLAQLSFQSDRTGWTCGASESKTFRLRKYHVPGPAFAVSK